MNFSTSVCGLLVLGLACHLGLGFITPGAKPCLTVDNCWDCRTDDTLCDECVPHYGRNISFLCNPCTDDNCYECEVVQDICTNCTSPYESVVGECIMEEEEEDDHECATGSLPTQAFLTVTIAGLLCNLLKN